MDVNEATVGSRVRSYRLRQGMTQRALGERMGRTQGWVSRVEKGSLELDRTSVVNELARALAVHPNDLWRQPLAGPASDAWHADAVATVLELRRYDLPSRFDGEPRDVTGLRTAVDGLYRWLERAQYTRVIAVLPALLSEAKARLDLAARCETERAHWVYALVCRTARSAGVGLGHGELIALATERFAWAADRCGDPLLPAHTLYVRGADLWEHAAWSDSLALLDRALTAIQEPYEAGGFRAVQAWGGLCLRSAVTAARAGEVAEVDRRLRMAREAADRLPRDNPQDVLAFDFTALNVRQHGVGVAVEMGDAPTALDRAAGWAVDAAPPRRIAHHHMDVSRALLWQGRRERAFAELAVAERAAPQMIRNHPAARATLRSLINAERRSTREQLRSMSNRFGLDG